MTRSSVLVKDAAPRGRRGLAGDRCDRCCAEAVVHVVLRSGLDLAFCGHHARQHELQLAASGALIRGNASPSFTR
jgi:hypothetical protein